MKKDINKILQLNPTLAKEVAKLLKEELEQVEQVEEVEQVEQVEKTDLTLPEVPAGENDKEVVPEAPNAPDINYADVNGEGHSTDPELTAVDPVEVDKMIDEIPAEELEGEVEALEEVKEKDEKEVEKLDEVIAEAMDLKAQLQKKIVFTESVINKVNARMLQEAAKLIAKKAINEGKK